MALSNRGRPHLPRSGTAPSRSSCPIQFQSTQVCKYQSSSTFQTSWRPRALSCAPLAQAMARCCMRPLQRHCLSCGDFSRSCLGSPRSNPLKRPRSTAARLTRTFLLGATCHSWSSIESQGSSLVAPVFIDPTGACRKLRWVTGADLHKRAGASSARQSMHWSHWPSNASMLRESSSSPMRPIWHRDVSLSAPVFVSRVSCAMSTERRVATSAIRACMRARAAVNASVHARVELIGLTSDCGRAGWELLL